MGENTTAFSGFSDFYRFYLSQHTDRTCRRLHFIGTTLGLVVALHAFSTLNFFFEKNRPATFSHPLYSFMGDWVMWKDLLTGRIRF
jgi:hypothetical protein